MFASWIFCGGVTVFNVVSRMATTKWEIFVTTTLVFILMHAVDGLILIVFQERFRGMLCQPSLLWQKKSVIVLALASTSRIVPKVEVR
ncbi:hypothetical protein OSTOST_24564 [Ostertagia ostertagi]